MQGGFTYPPPYSNLQSSTPGLSDPGHSSGGAVRIVSNQTSVYENYKTRGAFVCALLQLIAGAIAVIIGITSVAFAAENAPYSISPVGHGIWTGILFVISGGLGIGASKSKSKCLVISFMVMSIISAAVGAGGFSSAVVAAVVAGNNGCHHHYYGYYLMDDCTDIQSVDVGLNSFMAILIFIASIAAIVASAFGCKVACCCGSTTNEVVLPVYYEMGNDGTQKMILVNNPNVMPSGQPMPTQQFSVYQQPTAVGYNQPADPGNYSKVKMPPLESSGPV